MSGLSTPAPRLASNISHGVALTLLAASATMNTAYGWSKGDTFATQCVWAAIAAGSAIIFTLAFPALTKAFENRNWSAVLVALLGLVLFGAHNVTAALGSAAGGRTNAATAEADTADIRNKAHTAYNGAKAELDTLKASRPVAELEPLLEAVRPQCRVVVTSNSRETVCAKPPALVAELGRAKRRAELEAKMAKATEDLSANMRGQVANSDAKALAEYLNGLGFKVDQERVNKWLVLLAVLLVECGAGISMTIGLAFSAPTAAAPVSQHGQQAEPAQTAVAAPVSQLGTPAAILVSQSGSPPAAPTDRLGADIITALNQAGGRVESLRRLADQIGRPRAAITAECKAMATAGLVMLARGRHGTMVELRRSN